MSRTTLRLVHDACAPQGSVTPKHLLNFENARQLSLFQEDERDHLVLVTMSSIDRYGFKNLLEAKRPSSIIDTRRFPDFFGFFRSTQIALELFGVSNIEYLHVPLDLGQSKQTQVAWELRKNMLNGLSRTKMRDELFGQTSLVLVASEEVERSCNDLLHSLPDFNNSWNLSSY